MKILKVEDTPERFSDGPQWWDRDWRKKKCEKWRNSRHSVERRRVNHSDIEVTFCRRVQYKKITHL